MRTHWTIICRPADGREFYCHNYGGKCRAYETVTCLRCGDVRVRGPKKWIGRGKPVAERLWSRVRKTDGCWFYEGARQAYGYGLIRFAGKSGQRTHRVAWELTNGPIPDGLVVRHKCDEPSCVRPDHLELGTHADNVYDCVTRGRRKPRGLNRVPGFRVLADHLRAEVLRAYQSLPRDAHGRVLSGFRSALAAQYGVSTSVVHKIGRGA